MVLTGSRDLLSLSIMEQNTRESGMRLVAKMVKVCKSGLTDLCTRDTGKLIRQTAEVD